jgi:lipopolysaccharide exporter
MRLNRIYTCLRHPGESLSQRVVHAGFWAFALRITSRLFGLARTIVLARLLAPNDFGLYGIALLSLSALETFSQTGFDQALIQKKEDTKPYLDTAWTVQVIRGFVLATLLVLGAPLVGSFFGEPRAVLLVQVLGAAVLLKSLRNIGIVYFRKDLEFHKQFLYEFGGTFADLAVAIPAAFILRSVWALVFGLLAGNSVRMVLSYFVHSYRPRLGFNNQQFRELFVFGKWLLGSSAIIFLITQGDDAFVGKLLGTTALGLYQLAYRISNFSATEITHVVSQVTLPAYSKLQTNVQSLLQAYGRVLRATFFVALPIAAFTAVLAPELTRVFLGEKWMPMTATVQVLCAFGFSRAINGTFGAFFQGIGMPRVITGVAATQLIVMAALIYPLTAKMGIMGTAIAVTFPNILVLMPLFGKLSRILGTSAIKLLRPLLVPLLACSVTVALIMTWKVLLHTDTIGIILALLALSVLMYLGFSLVFGKLIWRKRSIGIVVREFIGTTWGG